jgi:O-antigen ligase
MKALAFEIQPRTTRRNAAPVMVIAALVVTLAALMVLVGGSYLPILGVVAVAGIAGLWYGAAYTRRHLEWVLLPILLTFALISFAVFSDEVRAPIHYGLLAIFCLPLAPIAMRSGLLKEGGFRLYMYYLGFAAFSIVYSIAPAYSLARFVEATMVALALVAVASEINNPEDVDRLLSHYFIGCAIVTALMIVSLVVLPRSLSWVSPEASIEPDVLKQMRLMGVTVDGIERFQSLFSGPNDVGAFMLVTMGVGLARWNKIKGREKLFVAITMGSSLLCAALADSRSPFVAVFVGAGLYTVWRYGLRGILWMSAAAALVAGVLLLAGYDFAAYLNRGDVTTLTGRTEMWRFVIRSIADHPVLGFGYEVGGAIFDSRFFPLWWGPWDQGPHVSVHNGYLAHAVGVGIPVTIFWLYIVLSPWVFVLRRGDDSWQLKRLFFLIVIPILIHNLSEVMADDATGTVGFLFGLVWVISERYRLLKSANERLVAQHRRASMPRAAAALLPS